MTGPLPIFKRKKPLKASPLLSLSNEIAEIKSLYREGILTEREFYIRLRRLGLDTRAANQERRSLLI